MHSTAINAIKPLIQELTAEKQEDKVQSIIKEPKNYLASASKDGKIKIWDVDTAQCIQTFGKSEEAPSEGFNGESFNAPSKVTSMLFLEPFVLATGSSEGKIYLWDVKSGNFAAFVCDHAGSVNCLMLLGPGRLASGSEASTIKVWELTKGVGVGRCTQRLTGHEGAIKSLAIVPDFLDESVLKNLECVFNKN